VSKVFDVIVGFFKNFETGNYSLSYLNAFYADKGCNSEQMYISDIHELMKDDDWTEDNHRYIQWLFPLNELSHFNFTAPVLTDAQIDYLRESSDFQRNLTKSFWRMMRFYGFTEDTDYENLLRLDDVTKARVHWLKAHDHNHLRISRILNCLDLFERADLADMLRFELKQAFIKHGTINPETIMYWKLDI